MSKVETPYPRICIPVVLRPDQAAIADALSVSENPRNESLGLAALVTAKKWRTGRRLTVAFRGGRQRDRNAFLAAGREWAHYANLKIVTTTDGESAVLRVAFWDATGDRGSWSYVGTDALVVPRSSPTINLGWPEDMPRDLHEWGHALGLIHEHQNPQANIPWDVDAVYRYYTGPPNYWTREDVDAQVLGKVSEPLTNGGFDLASIMLYPIPRGLLIDPSFAVGWNRSLSPGDKSLIGRCYPFST